MNGNQYDWNYYMNAYRVFRKVRKLPYNQNTARQFRLFLGIPNETYLTLPLGTEEARRKLDWLNSPNAEILYKVWEIQNGVKA